MPADNRRSDVSIRAASSIKHEVSGRRRGGGRRTIGSRTAREAPLVPSSSSPCSSAHVFDISSTIRSKINALSIKSAPTESISFPRLSAPKFETHERNTLEKYTREIHSSRCLIAPVAVHIRVSETNERRVGPRAISRREARCGSRARIIRRHDSARPDGHPSTGALYEPHVDCDVNCDAIN